MQSDSIAAIRSESRQTNAGRAFAAKAIFRARSFADFSFRGYLETTYFSLLGTRVGRGTLLRSASMTWPHQVTLGQNCTIESRVIFKFDGPWMPGPRIRIGNNVFIGIGVEFNISEGIEIGDDTLIASGTRLVDHNHGTLKNVLIRKQQAEGHPIRIGRDCWIGANAVVLQGVTISDGAVVGADAVVNRSIAAHEIWAGVPARKVGSRH